MPLSLLSFFLSFFLNILFITVILIGVTIPIKKQEEVKITLLEPIKTEIFQALPKEEKRQASTSFPNRNPLSTISKPQEKVLPKEEPLNEELLKERLSQLEEKVISKKEESLLKRKLSQIEKKALSREENLEDEFIKNKIASLDKYKKEVISQSEPSESFKNAALSEDYLLLIKRKLQTHFEIPIYLKDKKDLSVIVEIEVSSDGSIKRVIYLKKSKDPVFNKAVERCLLASNPLPVAGPFKLKVEFKGEGALKFN